MQAEGLQSDERFARDFVAAKWATSQWGASRLRAALMQKGVGAADADAAIDWLQQVGQPRS